MLKFGWKSLLLVSFSLGMSAYADSPLLKGFKTPPPSARPHTWWHWMHGNVTREGITKDLEAMRRIGLGGFQAFHVTDRIPKGPVDYLSPAWRELMTHTVREADRLGLEMCLHNCGGWSSSGGPWITPEYGMFMLTLTEQQATPQTGPIVLEQPPTKLDYYLDIAVLAFPTPATEAEGGEGFRLQSVAGKVGFRRANNPQPDKRTAPPGTVIPLKSILNLTGKLGAGGVLAWTPPAGEWTLLRIGYTPTGQMNATSPPEAHGLECDKLSRIAAGKHWEGIVQKVLDDAGPLAGKTLNNLLIDSYETGQQNWTHNFADQFRHRMRYDLTPYLVTITGRVVDSVSQTERFLWDFRRTIADLFRDEYFGAFRQLCHQHGMSLSIEPYGGPGNFHNLEVAALADIPMGEFWVDRSVPWHRWTVKLCSSAAHAGGKRVVGAEAFTCSAQSAGWRNHPASLKAQGDLYFSEGLNRIIFHSFAHKPWPDTIQPGMTMGPHGIQMNRKNTWFNDSRGWIDYLTRCQYLLQQGQFVADLCYVWNENTPNRLCRREDLQPPPPRGYDYDAISTTDMMKMTVDQGWAALPSGMRYRVLVLPDDTTMRPAVLAKVKELVAAGATVYGSKPQRSPSLVDYPACDETVRKLANKLWADNVIGQDRSISEVFADLQVAPDFEVVGDPVDSPIRYLHRRTDGAEVYYVTNLRKQPLVAECLFRVAGQQPEIWLPHSGVAVPAAVWSATNDDRTSVTLRLEPEESLFVLFTNIDQPSAHLVDALGPAGASGRAPDKLDSLNPSPIEVHRAAYGIIWGGNTNHEEIRESIQQRINEGEKKIVVGDDLVDGDAPEGFKQFAIDYTSNGVRRTIVLNVGQIFEPIFDGNPPPGPPRMQLATDRKSITASCYTTGDYAFRLADGRVAKFNVALLPAPIELTSPWQATLPELGDTEPQKIELNRLVSLSEHPKPNVARFSGTATYRHRFTLAADRLNENTRHWLDLGEVQIMARVELNGQPLGVLWKAPYTVEVTNALQPGKNELIVHATNLWANRLIDDERRALPPAPMRDITINEIPANVLLGEPASDRETFVTWRHWMRSDDPPRSGLIGPVRIYTGVVKEVIASADDND